MKPAKKAKPVKWCVEWRRSGRIWNVCAGLREVSEETAKAQAARLNAANDRTGNTYRARPLEAPCST